ncbi:MAG TPA: glycosyltransferase [Polyangiaceae bacterium]|nr:glycosyltransferase [Polyangiaceae bacterium]
MSNQLPAPRIAVLIPCYNEEIAIGDTVAGLRVALPEAEIYVYDNNSKDRTMEVARRAGAIVRQETLQGKGHVVRRMFSDIEADVYLMTDGDATYDAKAARTMIDLLIRNNLDMVVGRRIQTQTEAYRAGHVLGNKMLTTFLAQLFGQRFTDILSGYRAFSRRFAKSFPALSAGFETETELTVHALTLSLPIAEVETDYFARPPGSVSKLSTYRDGVRILRVMLMLFKNERPIAFFGIAALVLALVAVALSIPVVITYWETGLVPRFPTAILSASIMLLAFLSVVCGLVLDTVTRGRREMKRLAYLQIASPLETVRLPVQESESPVAVAVAVGS